MLRRTLRMPSTAALSSACALAKSGGLMLGSSSCETKRHIPWHISCAWPHTHVIGASEAGTGLSKQFYVFAWIEQPFITAELQAESQSILSHAPGLLDRSHRQGASDYEPCGARQALPDRFCQGMLVDEGVAAGHRASVPQVLCYCRSVRRVLGHESGRACATSAQNSLETFAASCQSLRSVTRIFWRRQRSQLVRIGRLNGFWDYCCTGQGTKIVVKMEEAVIPVSGCNKPRSCTTTLTVTAAQLPAALTTPAVTHSERLLNKEFATPPY